MELKVTYDPAANAAYIRLVPIDSGEAVRQEVVEFDGPGDIILDFNHAGEMIGIEILNARALLPRQLLGDAGRPDGTATE